MIGDVIMSRPPDPGPAIKSIPELLPFEQNIIANSHRDEQEAAFFSFLRPLPSPSAPVLCWRFLPAASHGGVTSGCKRLTEELNIKKGEGAYW